MGEWFWRESDFLTIMGDEVVSPWPDGHRQAEQVLCRELRELSQKSPPSIESKTFVTNDT